MSICKEKPATLPPLDAIGIEPLDHSSLHLMRGGSGRHRTSSTALPPSQQASIGLGFAPSTMGKGSPKFFQSHGELRKWSASKLSSEDRFNASSKLGNIGQSQASSISMQHQHQKKGFEPVAPLQATANCWDRKTFQADGDSPEMVVRNQGSPQQVDYGEIPGGREGWKDAHHSCVRKGNG